MPFETVHMSDPSSDDAKPLGPRTSISIYNAGRDWLRVDHRGSTRRSPDTLLSERINWDS